MAYQTPITIVDVVRGIQNRTYVLPDIQREFVWSREQIENLFDSLMRGYPIGSFLFWHIQDPGASGFRFYDFIAHYDVREPHNDPATLLGDRPIQAVLDGQQRMTALNIAMRGSLTEKAPRLRWDNPAAFQKAYLYLDVLNIKSDAAPDERMYEFRFLTPNEASTQSAAGDHHWLRVSDALAFNPDTLDHEAPLEAAGLGGNATARQNAFRLTQLVHRAPVVAYYLERENDLDKVLNIFIRVNSGGTKLSYSDLLMSVATARWQTRDAREEVHDLVDDLNSIGEGFSFGRDRALKASLVLSRLQDIRLKARNMLDNMLTVESNWDKIERAMLLAARLLHRFGLSRENLTAENVIIPVAYYVARRALTDSYLTSPTHHDDRESLRLWVVRSLLRAGFWTGAVDPILIETRRVIEADGADRFPDTEIEAALKGVGKTLEFTEGEVDDLLRTRYQSPRCVPLLSLLYPSAVVRSAFHTDHVFPRALLRRRQLSSAISSAGRNGDEIGTWVERVDQLPNLQLLTATENTLKSDLLPSAWMTTQVPAAERALRSDSGDLDALPASAADWFSWFEERKVRQEARLREVLRVPAAGAAPAEDPSGE